MIETEIKLIFADVEAARGAVTNAGGRLTIARRLLDDRLFDTPDSSLQHSGRALRVRHDGSGGFLTFKGPIHAGPLKAREETETAVGEPAKIEAVLESLGYACRFRAQKYREEYVLDDATIAIDETPMGVFVEIEGPAASIPRIAGALGRSPADYRVESYSMLWQTWRAEHHVEARDMTFGSEKTLTSTKEIQSTKYKVRSTKYKVQKRRVMVSALVLSAGLGTRLDPITRLVAKPAVPLGDRTLIEHVLAWLRHYGVEDVVLNLHHRPATITSVLGDGRHLGLRVRYSWEQPILGSAGGPRRALPLLGSDPFLIVNGDTLCDVDLTRMVEAHEASGARVTLAVVPHPAPDRYNGFLADERGVVTAWVPKGHAGPSWHFVGVQVAAHDVFTGIVDGVSAELVTDLYRAMIPHGGIRIFPVSAPFIDVGTPSDYLAAARAFDSGASPAARAGSIVWPSARVDPAAVIEDCLIIGDVRVPAGFRAVRSILAPASIVRPGEPVAIRDGVARFDLGAG